MHARVDSSSLPSPSSAASAPFPAWARTKLAPQTQAEAAFLAGVALVRLDALVRENTSWSGVFRRRLALATAVASVSRAGRAEDGAALRDALHLTRPGADPGPAGRHLQAWRALTSGSTGQWRSTIAVAAERLGAPNDEALQTAVEAAEACAAGARLAPFAAARCYFLARQTLAPTSGRAGEGASLAAGLADVVMARKLAWPFVLPLVAAPLFSRARRGKDPEADEGAQTLRVLFAYAQAAERACDLAVDLQRRAQKLLQAAPKLRAKGAGAALDVLLDEDSLSAATKIHGLSERGARRLFERLVELGVVRELTGRTSFRLYGL